MSLAETLDAIREGAKQRIPEELRQLMSQATAELRDSGIMNTAFNIGDTLPPFELPNLKGDLISSEDLVKRGAVVLTFYRGVW